VFAISLDRAPPVVPTTDRGGEPVIRRPAFEARADAEAAEIIAESEAHALKETMIRDLLDEGRRG
jgi:hypothetical protein